MGMVLACLGFSFKNLSASRLRFFAAVAGIAFVLFFVYLQIGFLQGAKRQATSIYHDYDFDLAIVSNTYQFMLTAQPFDRMRMVQAQALDSVEAIFSFNFAIAEWEDLATERKSYLLFLGVEPRPEFILDQEILNGVLALRSSEDILIDRFSHADLGPINPGDKGSINDKEVRIIGDFELGLFFYAPGAAIVDSTNFSRFVNRSSRKINFGFIKLKAGTDAHLAKDQLKGLLPDDVIVFTKPELIAAEENYFIDIKPWGSIFKVGVLVSFVTGAVILLQVIATDISTHIKEYATFKAIGFSNFFVHGSAVIQTLTLAICSYIVATLIATWVFDLIYRLTHFPVKMTQDMVVFVLAITLSMSVMIVFVTLRRLARAHPADLF